MLDRSASRGRVTLCGLGDGDAAPAIGERFLEVATLGRGTRIEVIESSALPDPVDYLQDHDEWVLVLDGSAVLDLDGTLLELGAGDWVLVAAGVPHRVRQTAAGTRWLAVHEPSPG